MKDLFVSMGRTAVKALASACRVAAAVSAALPATAGLQIRSRPSDVVATVRSPVNVTTLANGHTLVDFGKDAAGYVQFDAKGAGSYEMIIGEALDSSGAVNNTLHGGQWNCYYSYVTDKNGKQVECSLRAVTLSGEVESAGTFRVPMTLPWQKRFDGNAHVRTAAGDEVCPFRYIEVVSLPSGVSAEDLRQVMYHYPFNYDDSSFTSSDSNLNQVYDLCKWSLYADSYLGYWLDGDRERQFYQADAYVSILDSLGVFSDMTMNKRTAKEFFLDELKCEWSVEWYLYTFLTAFQDYWHSGDISTLQTYYDHIKPTATTGKFYRIPSQYQLENGLLASPKDGWQSSIIDWPQMYRYDYDMAKEGQNGSDNDDGRLMPIENALLCQQYRDLATTATALGKTADAAEWSAMATKIYNAYQEVFFDASCGLYRDKAKMDGYRSTKHSIQANAAALAFGMVPADKIAKVADFVANEGMKCGTYMAHLVLEGLGRAGRTDAAIAYMASTAENSWMNMINEGLTTCCETWSIASGSGVVGGTPDVNHPWSCAPASIISRYVLGVRPAAAGWTKATVAPQFGSLTQARGKVPTAKGGVTVDYQNQALTVTVPTGMAADVTFAGQTKTVAADAATRTVTISESSGGHTHSWNYVETKAPTCTVAGEQQATCSCGETLTSEISPLGHDWSGEWQVVTEVTETTPGEKRLSCKRTGCNEYRSEVIPVPGEDPGDESVPVWTVNAAVNCASFAPAANNLLRDEGTTVEIENNSAAEIHQGNSRVVTWGGYSPSSPLGGGVFSYAPWLTAIWLKDKSALTDGDASSSSWTTTEYEQPEGYTSPGNKSIKVYDSPAYPIHDNAVATFTFPKAATLRTVRVYGWWTDTGRNGLSVASVDVKVGGSWITLTTTPLSSTTSGGMWPSKMPNATLADSGTAGYLAKNVTALRINFGEQLNHEDGYAEIEAVGSWSDDPSGEQIAAMPQARSGLAYTGEEQTGVAEGTGYTITNHKKTNAGNYTATVTLADGYIWSDGESAKTRTVAWSIAKGENVWAELPSVSPWTWVGGETPETITISTGSNRFNASVTCDKTMTELKALTAGQSTTVTFTAAAGGDNYDALTHTVNVVVTEPGDDPAVTSGDWYRLNVKAVRGGDSGEQLVQISEFYLYDAQGNRLGTGLTYVKSVADLSALAGGQCCQVGIAAPTTATYQTADKLFDGDTGTKLCGTVTLPQTASVVLRLPAGSAAVAAYNFATGDDDENTRWGGPNRQLVAWTLERSADGVAWSVVDAQTFDPPVKNKTLYRAENFPVGSVEPEAKDPVVPGVESKEYATEALARAAAPTKVTPAMDVENALKGMQALMDYIACFTVQTQPKGDKWVNVAVLTEAAEDALQKQVDCGAVKVVDALAGKTVTLDSVTPGFYYGLSFGGDLQSMTTAGQAFELATGASLVLTLPKGGVSGFYRVVARETEQSASIDK